MELTYFFALECNIALWAEMMVTSKWKQWTGEKSYGTQRPFPEWKNVYDCYLSN
jgi:hypothetical protein